MKNFGKYIFETLAIFIGILLSFSVDRCTRENQEIEETKKSVLTLVKEIENNIYYCENHLIQLENMKKINEIITSDFTQNLKKDKLIELHNEYPFGHSYDINGNLIYWNKEENYKNVYQVRGNKFKVIGVLEKQGSSFGGGGDNRIIIPIETSRKLRPTANYEITVFVDNIDRINDDINYSQNLFKILRGDMIGSENSFEIERNESLDSELDEISTYLKIGGFTIGFITLLGASIGLMNIMLVSVTERTREIGLRKSIGATPKIIRDQFLIESILICLIGGFGGVTLGILFGNLVTIFIGGGSFIIPWLWVITGLLLSTLVGILSGYIPAMKASALDPIESLRFE